MGRVLFFVLLGLVAFWWLFGRTRRGPSSGGRPPAGPPAAPDEMVTCAHCGVHLPRGDALHDGALHYCGDEHRRLGPRRP